MKSILRKFKKYNLFIILVIIGLTGVISLCSIKNVHKTVTKNNAPKELNMNLQEWCKDWYENLYSEMDPADPAGPKVGDYRVIRGGGRGGNSLTMNVHLTEMQMEKMWKITEPDFAVSCI